MALTGGRLRLPGDAIAARGRSRYAAALRRWPFTIVGMATILVVALATGTLWDPLRDRALRQDVAYGVPAFAHGRWWSPVTGTPFSLSPAETIVMIVFFGVLVGFAEWRLGTKRTAVITLAIQFGGVAAATGIIAALRATGWDWAENLGGVWAVGTSTGAVGAVCAATATLRPPWRARLRAILVGYVVLVLLYAGRWGDVGHAVALPAGLITGTLVTGNRPRLRLPRASRHEWRLVAAGTFVVAAAVRLVVLVAPGQDPPLGPSSGASGDLASVLVGIVLPLALAEGLRRGRRLAWRVATAYCALATVAILILVVASVVVLASDTQIDLTGDSLAASAASAVLWLAQLAVLILGRQAFRGTPWRDRRHAARASETDQEAARRILREVGGGRLAWMTTWEGNRWYFAPDGQGYVAYQPYSGIAVALGDPVAAGDAERAALADAFVDAMQQSGLSPCFFSADAQTAAWGAERGWQSVEVAVEAVIDLPGLEFKGKSWQDVRTALNRAAKEDVTFRLGKLAEMPRGVLVQVRAISEQWMGDKGLPEMGFTLGGVEEAMDPEVQVGLAIDGAGTVHGVTSWLPVYGPGRTVEGWTLDVMRRLPDGFKPVMEFLIASACLAFREQGARFVSLSGAPLAGDPAENAGPIDRVLAWLGEQLEPLYGFRSLDRFKAKFFPRHESLYLVYPDEAILPRVGIAISRAYLAGATVRDLASAGVHALRH